tara:strand:- start:1033 stop:1569 length:537 start_codon:yes stop_codon:yes gene_type:complete
MLLAIATLGSGVSAEQSNERLSDLEDLGILELSMDDGVIEAMVTTDAFLTFMNSDEAALMVIESIDMNVGLSDEGELELTEIDIGVGEEQSDEIAVTLRLSDELVELLQHEDLDSEDLLRELGFGDDLGWTISILKWQTIIGTLAPIGRMRLTRYAVVRPTMMLSWIPKSLKKNSTVS